LGLYPKVEEERKKMELAEIKHGRLAMIAFSAFGLQEYVSKVGVVDETPFFFFPITETLRNMFG
jgi:TRAP-type C4-dicarboxylate transport system substrate-binding protein